MKIGMLVVKHRAAPKLAAIVDYNPTTGRKGRVLVSEPIPDAFTNADLTEAARRLVPQVADRRVILPFGIEL